MKKLLQSTKSKCHIPEKLRKKEVESKLFSATEEQKRNNQQHTHTTRNANGSPPD